MLSAIVLNYREPKLTFACVQALLVQETEEELEILIIDNHSKDDSIGWLRNCFQDTKSIRFLETPKNTGYGKGNNLGIRHAHGTYILIINPDTVPEPGALQSMIDRMKSDPSIGILGPKLIYRENGETRDSCRHFPRMSDVLIKRSILRHIFPKRLAHYRMLDADLSKEQDVDWIAGACLLLRRSLLEDIGAFDPRFFMFFEDSDLCRRCRRAGKRVVYFPKAVAMDRKIRLSEGGPLRFLFSRTGRSHLLSAIRYFWKWRGVNW